MMSVLMTFSLMICSIKSSSYFSSSFMLGLEHKMLLMMVTISIFITMVWVNSMAASVELVLYKSVYIYLGIMVATIVITKSMTLFIVLMELTVMPMVILILNFSKSKDKIESTMSMLILNMMGSMPFMSVLFMSPSIEFYSTKTQLSMMETSSVLTMLMYFIVLAAKMPIMMLHIWLTKAHVSASGPTSMILASIMIKMSSAGLMNLSKPFVKVFSLNQTHMFSLAVATSVFFPLFMSRIFDVKLLVAMSSVAHVCMMSPYILKFMSATMAPMLIMMISHALSSSMLFYMVSIMYEYSGSRSSNILKTMESYSKEMSKFMCFWLIINLGFPPFMGFLSEMMILPLMESKSLFCTVIIYSSMLGMVIYFISLMTQKTMGKGIVKKLSQSFLKFWQNNMMMVLVMIMVPTLL